MGESITLTAVDAGASEFVYVNASQQGSGFGIPGLSLTADLPDRNGVSSFATGTFLEYRPADPAATTVTISAPAANAYGQVLVGWTVDGVDRGGSSVTVGLDSQHYVYARYVLPGTVALSATGAGGGVTLTVTLDAFGVAAPTTPATLGYVPGTAVSVTAPLAGGSNFFARWLLDGALLTTSLTASLSATGAHMLTAVYEPRYVFTVTSAAGVTPTATADVDSATSGTLTYRSGTAVTLLAPTSAPAASSSRSGCATAPSSRRRRRRRSRLTRTTL